MEQDQISKLLQKLSEENILPEELRQLEDALWESTASALPSRQELQHSAQEYALVHQRILKGKKDDSRTPRIGWRGVLLRAACVAAIVIGGVLLYTHFGTASLLKPIPVVAWQTITSKPGEHHIVTLPDGSRLYLNGGSAVRIPRTFEGPLREVALLSGDMFIDVAADPTKAFAVKTGNLRINVLGTSFSVTNRPEDISVSIAVKTGKVSVQTTASRNIVLTPGKLAIVSRVIDSTAVLDCAEEGIGGWTTGVYAFEDATLQEIMTSFKYSHGIRYTIRDSTLAHRRFKAGFRGQTLPDMMNVLGRMGHFTYTIKDSIINIH